MDKKPRKSKAKKAKTHIFVATPMYGGMCTGYFTNSLVAKTNVMKHHDMDMSFSSMFNESLIQRGRNALVHQFLKSDCTHLLFIDADIKFDPNDIPTMVEADKDIICGIYPKKEINWPKALNRNFTMNHTLSGIDHNGRSHHLKASCDRRDRIDHTGHITD